MIFLGIKADIENHRANVGFVRTLDLDAECSERLLSALFAHFCSRSADRGIAAEGWMVRCADFQDVRMQRLVSMAACGMPHRSKIDPRKWAFTACASLAHQVLKRPPRSVEQAKEECFGD